MCSHGNERILQVPIAKADSHTGKFRWASKGVDQCIAPIVEALNNAGVYTQSSCCGHGEREGSIILQDGRELVIRKRDVCEYCGAPDPGRTMERGFARCNVCGEPSQ